MRICVYLLSICFLSSLCNAQYSPQYDACIKNAMAQNEMHVCANEEAIRVDSELNRVYKLLLSKVRGNPLATAKIKAAQKAWIRYRDAYIQAMYPESDKQAKYGSIFPMEVDLLGAKLSWQQIEALKDIQRHNDPDGN
jgi:uncharacterized protein YecT (DUF1311 family)